MYSPTSSPDLLDENETHYRLGHPFRQVVVKYIKRRHLDDGGYFFARVPPSSALDTYFAVKSLSLLGVKPDRPAAIADFFLNDAIEGTIGSMTSIFLSVEVLNELSGLTGGIKNYAQTRTLALQNAAGGFGSFENIDVETPSELQDTYRAVRVLKIIGADFDREKISRFTSSFLRPDGGYGAKGYSTLASTFYAIKIHQLLGLETRKLTATLGYLRKMEENWQFQFIEDLYWLVRSLANLGEKTNVPGITRFVMMCQRSNGGFSRATIMGIPTLEYTYYALSILREGGVL